MIRNLIPADEVARKLNVTRRTLQVWAKRGDLPRPVKIGRRAYYQPEVIDAFVEARIRAVETVPTINGT